MLSDGEDQNGDDAEKEKDDENSAADAPIGNFMFCDGLKKFKISKSKVFKHDDLQSFYARYHQPFTTNVNFSWQA